MSAHARDRMRERLDVRAGQAKICDRAWKYGQQVPTPQGHSGVRKVYGGAVWAFGFYEDAMPHGGRIDVFCATVMTPGGAK